MQLMILYLQVTLEQIEAVVVGRGAPRAGQVQRALVIVADRGQRRQRRCARAPQRYR